jgi:tetrahydromethanopterin S-methyltransferase subunit B
MTTSDVDRLYKAIDELTKTVHGYRADLNGRLRTLELANAERDGATEQKGNALRVVFGVAGMAAGIAVVVTTLIDRL